MIFEMMMSKLNNEAWWQGHEFFLQHPHTWYLATSLWFFSWLNPPTREPEMRVANSVHRNRAFSLAVTKIVANDSLWLVVTSYIFCCSVLYFRLVTDNLFNWRLSPFRLPREQWSISMRQPVLELRYSALFSSASYLSSGLHLTKILLIKKTFFIKKDYPSSI